MSCPRVIAIDGPVASGKTTLGRLLAERLGYTFFDTGVLYRALTWLALQRGIDPKDEPALARLAAEMEVRTIPPTGDDRRQYTVLVNGRDVTWEIRAPEVEGRVSAVSALPEVRQSLLGVQRRTAQSGRIVVVGRDIGTVVLPDADLKLYVTASPEERARRRWEELRARSVEASYDQLLEALRRRDEWDSRRAAAPLRPAPDAVHLNTDGLTTEDEVAFALRLVDERCRERDGGGRVMRET